MKENIIEVNKNYNEKFIRMAIEEKLQRDFKPKQSNRLEIKKLKDLYPTIF